MSKKHILGVNKDFIPFRTPVINGSAGLNLITKFPVYVREEKEGVPIVIRSGYMHTLDFPFRIINVALKDKFLTLIELLKSHKAIVNMTNVLHATLYSPTMSSDSIRKLLYKGSKKLPSDLKLIVTDMYYAGEGNMQFKARIEVMKEFFESNSNVSMPNVEIASYSLIEDRDGLENMTEHLLLNLRRNKGIVVAYPDGLYPKEKMPIEKLPMFMFSPEEELTGRFIRTESGSHPALEGLVADKVVLEFEGNEIKCSLIDSPVEVRKYFVEKASELIGRKVTFSGLNFAGYSVPKACKLVQVW